MPHTSQEEVQRFQVARAFRSARMTTDRLNFTASDFGCLLALALYVGPKEQVGRNTESPLSSRARCWNMPLTYRTSVIRRKRLVLLVVLSSIPQAQHVMPLVAIAAAPS